jgi:hydrogenase expression/formation protein HypC
MKVTEVSEDGMAKCRVGEGDTFVTASVALLPELPEPGDYVIVHAGFALRKLEPEDAEEPLRLLRDLLTCLEKEYQA